MTRTTLIYRRRFAGFSLTELMVAITLGLIILVAVSTVFVSSKKTYDAQDRLARVQENGRFAMHFLIRDLRLAGYYGCADDITSVTSALNTSTDFAFATQFPVEGYQRSSGTWYPSGVTGSEALPSKTIEPNTDAVVIRMLDPSGQVSVVSDMPNESASMFLNPGHGLANDDIVMVTDCSSADLFQVTNVQAGTGANAGKSGIVHNSGAAPPGTPGNATSQLSKSYGPPGATVMKFYNWRYFIARNTAGIPSLYRETVDGRMLQELVEGIESLQITYGKDTDGDPNKTPNIFLKAGDAGLLTQADWDAVVAVRVGILSRTTNNRDTDIDKATYDVNGYTFPAQNDRSKRRVFLSTVLMRNRI